MKTLRFFPGPILIGILLCNTVCFAEGTKQIMPTSVSWGRLEVYPTFSQFAYYNAPAEHRLNIHISNTSETVYFGFGTTRDYDQSVQSDVHYIVRNPSGTIIMGGLSTFLPTSGAGYIPNHAQAIAGPNTIDPGGYEPLSFNPATTGDYYIEFEYAASTSGRREFDFFDITVADAGGNPIDGRVWSKAWQFTCTQSNGVHMWEYEFEGTLFVYSDDGVVTSVDFNHMQPYVFTVSCNETGCASTGNFINDRMSVPGLSTYPQYKIFLNDPDSLCYPSGAIGTLNEPCTFTGCVPADYCINMNVDHDGLAEILLDLNGIPEYQAGSADVLFIDSVQNGVNCIEWDGLNGFGNQVAPGTTFEVYISFIAGLTHLPMYDVEFNEEGFIVEVVRPVIPDPYPRIYWDDTNVGGAMNLTGCVGPGGCHTWTGSVTGGIVYTIGESNTVNSWWYASGDVKDTVTVTLNNLSVSLDITDITCTGADDGAIGSSVLGGNSPYSYIWNPGSQTSPSLSGLSPGTYTVTVTDGDGCTGTATTVIVDPTVVTAVITDQTPSLCSGDCSGYITVTAGGGSGNYTFLWNDPQNQTLPTANNLCAGTYSVTVTDANGCSAAASATIPTNYPTSINNFIDTCSILGDTYQISFDINGSGPYSVIDNNTGLSAGNIDAYGHFTMTLPSDTAYSLTIDNGEGCGTFQLAGNKNCGCLTYAGTMLLNPIEVCEGNCITATHNGNEYLLADDVFEFIIHDGSGSYPYTALATSDDPVFCESDVPGLVYGQTYYISAIAGYEDILNPGHVDTEDSCYSQSAGVPVKWLEQPTAQIPLDFDEVCGKTILLDALNPPVGNGYWTSSTNQSFYTINGTSYTDPDAWVTVAYFGYQTFIWTVYNGSCVARDSILIEFKQIPTAYAGAYQIVCGSTAGLEAVFSIGTTG
ncbi:MAG: hypothetical protein KJ607_14645, partial [Bacteroidetes bacterium]|nr:hypothetical protein [Bacteroidota bacterium]